MRLRMFDTVSLIFNVVIKNNDAYQTLIDIDNYISNEP